MELEGSGWDEVLKNHSRGRNVPKLHWWVVDKPHKQSQPPRPVMISGAKGAHFWDADGNDYIDYLMGYGPMILGHAYPTVIDTVTKYLVERGNVYNFGHTLEVELAEKLSPDYPIS